MKTKRQAGGTVKPGEGVSRRPAVRVLSGNRVRIQGAAFVFPPGPVMTVVGEKKTLSEGVPTWQVGAGMGETRLVFRTVLPVFVRVYGADGTVFRRGGDDLLNREWGKMTRNPAGRDRGRYDRAG